MGNRDARGREKKKPKKTEVKLPQPSRAPSVYKPTPPSPPPAAPAEPKP